MFQARPALTKKAYFPMLVPEGNGSLEANLSLWERYDHLSDEKKEVLTSNELAWKMKEFQDVFRLSDAGVAMVSVLVRKLFFGEITLAETEERLLLVFREVMGTGEPEQAKQAVAFIEREVLTLKPSQQDILPEGETRSGRVRLSLLKALAQYPHLGEQMISGERIRLKASAEPVRPNLANWIKSYRDELGIGFHEEIERGRFLFQSPNGKGLTNEERARLNLILKSIEEEFPVEIDPGKQVIIFPGPTDATMAFSQIGQRTSHQMTIVPRSGVAGERSPSFVGSGKPVFRVERKGETPGFQVFRPFAKAAKQPEKNVSGETLHFSTGHVMPAERETKSTAQSANEALRQMQHPTEGIERKSTSSLPRSPYSIRPLRLRDERNAPSA
jgi:hypothetical protein